MTNNTDKSEKEGRVKALREAQKRLTWIDNVKRKLNYTQEQAEAEWTKIHNSQSKQPQP